VRSRAAHARAESEDTGAILLCVKFFCKTMLPQYDRQKRENSKSQGATSFYKLRQLRLSAKLWYYDSAKPWE